MTIIKSTDRFGISYIHFIPTSRLSEWYLYQPTDYALREFWDQATLEG
jgi:hypothetical protein